MEEVWPECQAKERAKDCEGEVNPARWVLGYRTCIKCGSPNLNQTRTVAPAYNKGPVMLIGRKDVKDIGR
jgi:hypothetical protein